MNSFAERHLDPYACVPGAREAGFVLRQLGTQGTDRQALFEHWCSLAPDARYLRFFSTMNDCVLRARANSIDLDQTRMFGAFLGNQLVSVAEWSFDPSASVDSFGIAVECAASTTPGFEGRSLGSALCFWSALDAQVAGADALVIYYLRANSGANAIGRKLGQESTRSEDNSVTGFIPIDKLSERFASGIAIKNR